MEVLTSIPAPYGLVIKMRWKVFSTYRKTRVVCAARIDRGSGTLRFRGKDKFVLESLDEGPRVRSFSSLDGLHEADWKLKSVNYDTYVVDGSGDVGGISRSGQQSDKILIPGLPNESAGEREAPITSCSWEWKPKLSVYYEKAGPENAKSPPVLFLPGFGVGSFHYEKQLKDLGREYRVWAIDFLGQGLSLPVEDPTSVLKGEQIPGRNESSWGFGDSAEPWASQLSFSVDLWRDQVQYFIEEVIGEPVYLVGNSLGGFVALYFAADHPHLVKGVTLLNATPFWGISPNPIRSPRLASIFPWSGTFPLPDGVKKLIEIFWQKISDPRSIAEILEQVYADHSTDVDKVFSRILEITEHPAAAASLASIIFAPRGQLSFRESLSRCKANNVPICLVYGKEDPWVRPIWGHQVKRKVPEAPYYEISPAGHCPHDEVPEVVNYLLRGWINHLESKNTVVLPLLEDIESAEHNTGKVLEFVRNGSKKSVKVQFHGSVFSLWNWIRSYFNSQFRRLEANS